MVIKTSARVLGNITLGNSVSLFTSLSIFVALLYSFKLFTNFIISASTFMIYFCLSIGGTVWVNIIFFIMIDIPLHQNKTR